MTIARPPGTFGIPRRRRPGSCWFARNGGPLLQAIHLAEGFDKNTTVVFPAPLMSTIEELGSFLAREKAAALAHQNTAAAAPLPPDSGKPALVAAANGAPESR